jgi:ubiquinone/menaquinone biosynthesis C-methylase UbiE
VSTTAARFYDRWARVYDLLATAPPVGRWRKRAVDALDLDPGDTVVEMGCGSGGNLPYLRERVGPSGRVVGIDVSTGQLRQARQRVGRADWTNVPLVRTDAARPPVERADAVLATFVVGMFDDPAVVVETWLDLLEAGDRLALLNFQSSAHPIGRALSTPYEAFVRLSSPGGDADAAASLDRRVRSARLALSRATVDRRYESFGLGYLGLFSGAVSP